jgi:hypothetical protein
MQRACTRFGVHRKQALNVGIPVRAATGGRHLGWHQWLYQWGVGAHMRGNTKLEVFYRETTTVGYYGSSRSIAVAA